MKRIQKNRECLQSIMWLLRNAWAMTNTRAGLVGFYSKNCLLEQNREIEKLMKAWEEKWHMVYI